MGDRTYVFRLRGDNGDFDKSTDASGKAIDALGAKAQDFGKAAGVAGQAAAKGFSATGEAAKQATGHTEGFSFATAGAKRELLVLAHELSQGNYKQFAGSMLVLGERTGAAALLFSGLGVAALAAAGSVALLGAQVVKGYLEQQQFNKDLLITGNYAGQTAGSVDALAKSVAASTNSTVLQARAAITALAATGDVGPRVIGPIADAMVRVQKATGATTEEITKDFAKLGEEPAKFAAEHNRQYNFISGDQYAFIKRLDEQGNKEQAALEVSKLLSAHFAGPLADSIYHVGDLSKGVADDFANLINWMRKLGAETTAEDRLGAVNKQLQALDETARNRSKPRDPGNAFAALNDSDKRGGLEQERLVLNQDLLRKGEAALAAAEEARANKARIAAIDARDHWREETKGVSLVNKELEKYRKLTVEPLKGTAEAISASEQAATEAAIRKRFDPVGSRSAAQLDSRFNDRSVALQQEGAKLDAEIRSWELYGRAVDKGRLAVLNLEIAQGKLKGLSADKIAQLQDLARADDAKDRTLDQAKITAEVSKSIEALRSEANARAANARESEIARRIAEMEAKGIKVGTEAYIENAGAIRTWVDVKHDGILAQKLAAEGLANDAEVAKLDAETAALGKSTIERTKAIAVAKLQAEAERDLAANPGQRTQILDALAEKTEKLTAAQQRNYDASRTFETGVTSAFQKYQDEAGNAASFGERVVSGSLDKATDALTEFAETGKLKLGGLFKFMADEFIRNWVRMQVAQQTQSGGGLASFISSLAGLFGGGSGYTVDTGGASTNYTGQQLPTAGGRALGGDVRGGSAVVVGEHGSEVLFMGGQGGRVVSNSQLQASAGGRRAAANDEIHIHNYVGAQVSTERDNEGRLQVMLEQATERAANLGAARGHAMVTADLASGSGQASRAIKSRGVSLSGALAKRHGA